MTIPVHMFRSDGTQQPDILFAWGANSAPVNQGSLGLGDTTDRSSPVQVGASSWAFINHTGYYNHTAAINVDGALFTWGPNTAGKLGLNDTTDRSSPVQVGSSSWIAVAAGRLHTVGININGALFAWGYNGFGALGLGNTTDRSSPVQVGSSSWIAVTSGANYTLAIRADGALFAWGRNDNGQLGLNDTTDRSSPVQVGSSSWIAVAAGAVHVLALRVDGALFAWGKNVDEAAGQLGLNDTINRSSPVQVGSSSWSAIAAGETHSLGIKANGLLYAWGANVFGQLGNGTSGAPGRSSPIQIGSQSWLTISAGGESSFAIRQDYSLFAWGLNQGNGKLGLGDTNDRSSPVQVGSRKWKKHAAGHAHTLGIRL